MNIFYNKKIALAKTKKRSVITAVILCCIMILNITVFAAADQKIELIANGSDAEVILTFPQAAAEEIASLQIALTVIANSDNAKIEFIPNSSLAAKIVESRYHSDTGVLNIYLAGTKALFNPSAPSLNIGKVRISAENEDGVSANVGVVVDSVKFVRGSELVAPDGVIEYPDAVRITAGSGGSSQLPDPPPASSGSGGTVTPPADTTSSTAKPVDTTSAPESTKEPSQQTTVQSGNDAPSESNTQSEVSQPLPQETVGENFNPADTSALSEALTRAGSYKQGTYTESSFNTLTEAVNKANALLSDPNASQEDIDKALLILENAIGMLTLRNDIPSGADNYGSENEVSLQGGSGDNNNNSNNDTSTAETDENGETTTSVQQGEQTSENGSNTDQQGSQNGSDPQGDNTEGANTNDTLGSQSPESSGSAENEGSDNSLVIWVIVLVVVAAALAALAIVAVMKANKKKDKKGRHSKGDK